ncbi:MULTISPECIES: acyltransferase [unclassified Serratia (in: enterobacteria)]|uniref:acyltransferase family protein n=1 Tax=unclassified Serratia (in: enterobacteria) TaxID=2647522 RepID=UPI00046A72D6|nr:MULTISPECIES: acyltransferase [unclassified Serratia (in: enterobacteria)]
MISASIIGMPAFINNRLTRFLGKASYSIYLMHGIVLYLMKAMGMYQWIGTLTVSGPMKFLISFTITASVTVGVSWLSYKFIEKPGIDLGKRFIAKKAAFALQPEKL